MALSTAEDNIGCPGEAVAAGALSEDKRIVAVIIPSMRAALANAG